MPDDSPEMPRSLPERPNLRHLKDQAKTLLRAGQAPSLSPQRNFKLRGFMGFPVGLGSRHMSIPSKLRSAR